MHFSQKQVQDWKKILFVKKDQKEEKEQDMDSWTEILLFQMGILIPMWFLIFDKNPPDPLGWFKIK